MNISERLCRSNSLKHNKTKMRSVFGTIRLTNMSIEKKFTVSKRNMS